MTQSLGEARKAILRRIARGLLTPLYSFHFIRRRALAQLNRHYREGALTLRYRMPDHTLFLDPADDVIAARVLLRGDWQRRDLEWAVGLLRKHVSQSGGKVFVDVGANIGTETIYAMLSGYFAGAVSIEPEPGNFALLKENIAVNGLETRVGAFNCAAGARAEKAWLARSPSNKGGHAITSLPADGAARAGVAVDVLPLGEILRRAGFTADHVGLVWIDVNGTEADVLAGMESLLARRVPVVLEHLPSFVSTEAAHAIHKLLARHYRFYCRIDDVEREPVAIAQMNPLSEAGDFLFF